MLFVLSLSTYAIFCNFFTLYLQMHRIEEVWINLTTFPQICLCITLYNFNV